MRYHEIKYHLTFSLIAATAVCWLSVDANACPFCNATSQTLSEELAAADVTVIATLEKPAPTADLNDPSAESASDAYTGAIFRVQKVLKGEDRVKVGDEIEVVYFGADPVDKQFLINSLGGEKLDWTTPLPLSPRGVEYIEKLPSLPANGKERLKFFMGHLEDADPLLAQDGYDEFARAPYQELIDLKDDLDREQLVTWINDSKVGPTHRRLYLTMLGVCGTAEDAVMLESLLKYDYESMRPGIATLIATMGVGGSSLGMPLVNELAHADVRAKQQCLDALIAAYLKLKGPEGLKLVEERFLSNPQAEYTQLYSTIMALRFHGEESSEIPRERLVKSLRLLLNNTEIADQVIPDLTRWEDWEIMDQLVQQFKDSDEDGWIRQPVLAYLLTAAEQPDDVGTKATAAVEELEAIDPTAVKRARSYLSFGLMARGGGSVAPVEEKKEVQNVEELADESDTTEPIIPEIEEELDPQTGMAVSELAETGSVMAKGPLEVDSEPPAPSRTMIIVVPLAIGLLLVGLFGVMLRGGHSTS
ncbi:hypothetical protein [Bythopirellula polymerisocia]|uniref:Uncharacterized protein n=1 Tax=Bythopirellula polymerisocia TaxID=2528003 RepID=A0A5C6CUM9_9BACT|nr:hypothetical protein [Bythopirellula polymerisocia]TWU28232.1 hypothetical protein Pla144_15190 [Bythopirellula polymerisocia]